MKDNRIIDLHRARELILDMMATDRATFSMSITEKHREEFVEVHAEYEICGVHYAKGDGTIKLIMNLNSLDPAEVDIDYDKFQDALAQDIPRHLPFLVKDTYTISCDYTSLIEAGRQCRLSQFKEEIAMAIESHGFSMDDVLPVILDFLESSMKESSYATLEDIKNARQRPERQSRPVLEISPPGVPCPHCNGMLSEEALHGLMMKLYMRHRRGRHEF